MRGRPHRTLDLRTGVFREAIDCEPEYEHVQFDHVSIVELLPAADPHAVLRDMVDADTRRTRPFVSPGAAAYSAIARRLRSRPLPSPRTTGPVPEVFKALSLDARLEAQRVAEHILEDDACSFDAPLSISDQRRFDRSLESSAGRRAVAAALGLLIHHRRENAAILTAVAVSVTFAAGVARDALVLAQRFCRRANWDLSEAVAFGSDMLTAGDPASRCVAALLERDRRAAVLHRMTPEHVDVWCGATAAAHARALLARNLFVDPLPAGTWIDLVKSFVSARNAKHAPGSAELRRDATAFWSRAEDLLLAAGVRGGRARERHPVSLAKTWDTALRAKRKAKPRSRPRGL